MKKITLLLLLLTVSITAQDIIQTRKITSPSRFINGLFGRDVDISGDLAVVGEPFGNNSKGRAYLYTKNSFGNWSLTSFFNGVNPTLGNGDRFGEKVEISGNYIAVGVPFKDVGVGSFKRTDAGMVYMFEKSATSNTVSQKTAIFAPTILTNSFFGSALSISGTTVVIGNQNDGTDVSDNSNGLSKSGSILIYDRNSSGNWVRTTKILSPNPASNEQFGSSVSISDDYLVVGTNSNLTTKKVYIYKRNAGVWSLESTIDNGATSYQSFGFRVEISNDNIIFNSTNITNTASSIHFYQRNSSTSVWSEKSVFSGIQNFGADISISDNKAIVGSFRENTDFNGNNNLTDAGAAYYYAQIEDGTWIQQKKLTPNTRYASDRFGYNVALDGDKAMISSYLNDYDANEANFVNNSGAIYTFESTFPAGFSQNLKLWLKPDTGLTANSSNEVSNWLSITDNSKVANAINVPTKSDNAINFNPVVSFDGTNAGFEITNGILGTDSYDDMWVYTVQNIKTLNNSVLFREEISGSNRFGSHLPWGDGTAYYDFGVVTGLGRIQTNPNTVVTNKTSLWTLATSTSTDTPSGFRKNISENGRSIVTSNNDNSSENRAGNNSDFYLGVANSAATGFNYYGDIAEMIVYGSKPTEIEQRKIQSYLAIKYGITLDNSAGGDNGDYIASDGSVFWDALGNASHHNNIVAISKDLNSGLQQNKSKSINTGSVLTIEKVGGIVSDKATIVMGSNTGAINFTNKFAPPVYNILERSWKMQVTVNPGVISMSFTIPNNTGNIADYAILIDADTNFSSGAFVHTAGDISGDEVTFINVPIQQSKFYTLGKIAPDAPGNVTQNIALWIKPGTETVNTTSGVAAIDGETVDTWNDLSGDDTKSFTKGVLQSPILRNNVTDNINYNSVVDFTGDDKGMYIGSSKHIYSDGVSSEDGMTWFAVVKPNDQASSKNQQFIYDFGNNSGGGYGFAYGDENLYMYSPADFGGVASAVTNHTNATQTALTRHIIDFNTNQTVNLNGNLTVAKTDAITLAKLTADEINEFHTSAFQNAAGAFTIGRQSKAGGHVQNGVRSYDGKIAEVIGYRKVLSAAEIKKVESYLAIKYALTIDNTGLGENGDYVDSVGDVIWDASFNPPSQNKIIGIGRDDKQQLLQKQSHTVNDSIRLYVGNLAITNALNSGSFTNNRSYVIAGGVGKLCATPASNSESTAGNVTRMERELKITKSNFSDTFSIDFTMDACATIAINKVRLMVDTDSNFNNGNTTLFADGDNGLSITYNNPVITVSGISSSHIPDNSIRWITLTDINTTLANVTTADATLVDGSFATLGGEVLGLGGTSVSESGIIYSSTNTTPEVGGADVTKADNGTNLGVFTEVISGLNLSTTYYYRSYAINSSGTAYGEVKTFTTLANETNNYIRLGGFWSLNSSWSLGRTPIATDNVVVLSGKAGDMNIANLVVNNFTNLGTTTINKVSAITVNGDFTNSGTINVISDASDSGVLLVKGSSTGIISYSRGGLLANKWSLVTPPVKGDKVISFVQNVANDIRVNTVPNPDRYAMATYNDGNALGTKWQYYNANTNANVEIDVASGYSLSRATDGAVTFTGTLEVSNIDKGVSISQWNAIGNSFTTYYPINKNSGVSFLDDNSGKLEIPSVYIWDNAQVKYVSISNLISSTERFFTPAQGFFVKPNAATTLLFDSNKRSLKPVSGVHIFNRTTNTTPYIKLYVEKEAVKVNTDIIYSTTATKGFDIAEDIENFAGASFDITSHLVENSDGKNYTTQSLPVSEIENLVVPLDLKGQENDEVIFSIETFNFPANINVYLEDKLTNQFLKLDETNSNYKITLLEDTNGIGRFYLHTSSQTLTTGSDVFNDIKLYKLNSNTLIVRGLNNHNVVLKMYDILGKQVFITSFKGKNKNEVSIPNLQSAVYFVELTVEKGKLNRKIIIE